MDDDDIIFDFNKLKGKIKEVVGTQGALANNINMGEATLSNKLNNNIEFSSKEIVKISKILNIENETDKYFFTLKVQ